MAAALPALPLAAAAATPKAHQVVEEWGKRFGGLARFKLLHDAILITDPVVVEEVLGRRGAEELPKPALIYKPLDPIYSSKSIPSFFTTPDTAVWAAVRKDCAPAFSPDNMRKAFPVVRDVVQQVGDHLEAQAASPAGRDGVDLQDAALRVALDAFALTALQHDFGARRCGECEVLQVLPGLLAEFSLRALNPLRAVLHALVPWSRDAAAFSSNLGKAHALWAQLAAEVQATDLAAAEAAGDTSLRVGLARLKDPATGQPLSEEQLAPHIAAFLVAGFETTAHPVAWALYEVARHQEVQAKLAAELAGAGLAAAPGRPARQLEQTDLSSLPYLDQVWREALRLHPVGSVGPIRLADRDITLKNGLHVPKGTMLWTSACAIHTSESNYIQPQRFWPERWAQPASSEAEAAAAAKAAAAALGRGERLPLWLLRPAHPSRQRGRPQALPCSILLRSARLHWPGPGQHGGQGHDCQPGRPLLPRAGPPHGQPPAGAGGRGQQAHHAERRRRVAAAGAARRLTGSSARCSS
ncbi:hypothetical protein ABPG75_008704 [Micractinium tetrahymenae]